MNAAIKSETKLVHLSGFARWRDKNGNGFAPCGTLICMQVICNQLGCDPKDGNLRCRLPKGHDGPGDAWYIERRKPKPSTAELPLVTCPVCQEQAGALGKAYAQARRKKEIPW